VLYLKVNFLSVASSVVVEAEMRNPKEKSAEFMLAEYERLSSLRQSEITQTEQRFNFFLTVATTATGGIVVLSQVADFSPQAFSAAMQVLLSMLLLFGLTNQNRQIARTLQIDFYNEQITKIQDYFAKSDSDVIAFLDWRRDLLKRSQPKLLVTKIILARFRGSLIDLVTLSNSTLCAGLAFAILSTYGGSAESVGTLTIVTFIVATIILNAYNSLIRKALPLAL
jgi:hypothetical protein